MAVVSCTRSPRWTPESVRPPRSLENALTNAQLALADERSELATEPTTVSLTRDGAILMTLARNRSLAVQRYGPRVADTRVPEARAEFDPAVLENPAAMPGPLLSADHVLDFYSPVPGRFNVAVYPATDLPGFTGLYGTLFTLSFEVNTEAIGEASFVRITSAGTPGLPASNLTGAAGSAVPHTTKDGIVRVAGTAARETWMLYE